MTLRHKVNFIFNANYYMSQLQETRQLTSSQIETIMQNWFKVLNVKSHKVLASGKPVFSKENEQKWNLPHITKFANNYTLYRCECNESLSTCDDVSKKNDSARPTKSDPLFFIVLETDKFDKLNISACIWYYHLFEDELDNKRKRPQVFICPAFVVTDAMLQHVPINVLPCLYRFVSLCDLYPMLGSKNGLFGMSYDYKIIGSSKDIESCNGRVYPVVFDYDPMARALNALPGDIIEYKRILFEAHPYAEINRREVTSTMSGVNVIAPSGICFGKDI